MTDIAVSYTNIRKLFFLDRSMRSFVCLNVPPLTNNSMIVCYETNKMISPLQYLLAIENAITHTLFSYRNVASNK